MKTYLTNFLVLFIIILSNTNCKGQKSTTINPFYNGHLSKYFDPQQIDFHQEYYNLRQTFFNKNTIPNDLFSSFDFSSLWPTKEWVQNGIIGLNYQRIQIHIEKAIKHPEKSDTYLIFGKSKVNTNICEFKGEIKVLKTYFFKQCDDPEIQSCGVLFGEYLLKEDSLQYHSGIFQGITEAYFYLDTTKKMVTLDETSIDADGYNNRTFVGTWTAYKTKNSKKCIWGDYRLPFTFDFDQGDGELVVNEKYINNGWQTYSNQTEFIELPDGTYGIKDKWWLNK